MKVLISTVLISLSLLTISGPSAAADEYRYVNDVIWLTMRSGPGTEYKVVVSGIRSGTKMLVTEKPENSSWYKVILQNDKKSEGWVQHRYLIDEPIAKDKLAAAEKELATLKASLEKTNSSLSTLKSNSASTSQNLTSLSKERDQLKKELERIKEISANALTLDMRNTELLQENQELKNNLDVLKIENQYLNESNVSQEWMVGGTIAFIGILAGFFLARGGKKRGGAGRDSWA